MPGKVREPGALECSPAVTKVDHFESTTPTLSATRSAPHRALSPQCKALSPGLPSCLTMPMIDIYAPADLFPAGTEGLLGKELTMAVLRAEGVATPGPFHLNNTAAFVHLMDPHAVHTAATNSARSVRVQVITPPAALTREGQKQLVKEITEIVTKVSGDPTLSS